MRLAITADIHYGLYEAGDQSTRRMAEQIAASGADLLVLAGDNAAMDPGLFTACFHAFDSFPGRRLAICGNHDLWTRDGNSIEIYEKVFPSIAEECGFECLEGNPVVWDRVAIVGSVAWYDYSFRDRNLQLDDECYVNKYFPLIARWNDGRYVKMDVSDQEFNSLVIERLEQSIRAVYESVDIIVAITHHVAFDCMLIRRPGLQWRFCNAFMGSRALGRMLLKYPKVRYHVCGHTHMQARHTVGHIETISVGADYYQKRFELIEIE